MKSEKSILLVEPDQKFRKTVSGLLRKSGYTVVIARNGSEALNVLSNNIPDVIISALRMPKLDGIELMGEIKRTRVRAPVIFVTAYGDLESYMDLMNMGAYDYLNKPIKEQEILHVVRSALGEFDNPHRFLSSSRAESFA